MWLRYGLDINRYIPLHWMLEIPVALALRWRSKRGEMNPVPPIVRFSQLRKCLAMTASLGLAAPAVIAR
jgi:hypothetical protein